MISPTFLMSFKESLSAFSTYHYLILCSRYNTISVLDIENNRSNIFNNNWTNIVWTWSLRNPND